MPYLQHTKSMILVIIISTEARSHMQYLVANLFENKKCMEIPTQKFVKRGVLQKYIYYTLKGKNHVLFIKLSKQRYLNIRYIYK